MALIVDVFLKQTRNGLGIFASKKIKKNHIVWVPENIRIFTNEEFEKMSDSEKEFVSKYACSLSNGSKYVDLDISLFWNHSCNPNTKKLSKDGDIQIASADITVGEELTYDYTDDPSSFENGFICSCGSRNCKGIINKKN